MNIIGAFMLFALLASAEQSLQTSLIWHRSKAWWTPWLYKTGSLSVADFFIIAITIITMINIVKSLIKKENPFYGIGYLPLCMLTLAYLFIGLIYNLGVYTFWKTYFYDCKIFLYLTVPYFFLRSLSGRSERIRSWFSPGKIFIYYVAGSIIDMIFVNIFGRAEYPRYLGLPTLPVILPAIVCIAGFYYARNRWLKILFAAIFLVDLVSAVNRLSLGVVFSFGVALVYFMVIKEKIGSSAKYVLTLVIFIMIFFLQVVIVYNPVGLVQAKSEGATTRMRQFQNVLMNYENNFPMIVGKGLGSTWVEYIQVAKEDVYSVGTSMARNRKESMDAPVKFIFNFKPAGILYKWGILGILLLIGMIVLYFQGMYKKILWLKNEHLCTGMEARYLTAVLVVIFMFMMDNFTYIGSMRYSLMTSLLVFFMDNKMREYALGVSNRDDNGQ